MQWLTDIIEGLFFQTDRNSYWQPRHFGLTGSDFTVSARDGAKLSCLYLPAPKGPAWGTVFFCNCGMRTASFNLPQVSWLPAFGLDVIAFDYRGAGKSQGRTTLAGLREDAVSVLGACFQEKRLEPGRVVVFGQGPGAEAALGAARAYEKEVAGIVIESAYATHRGWMLGRYGPGIGHFCAACLSKNLQEPVDDLRHWTKPVALVEATRDTSVPDSETLALVAAAPSQRVIWRAEGAKHLNVFAYPCIWRERFLEFTRDAIGLTGEPWAASLAALEADMNAKVEEKKAESAS